MGLIQNKVTVSQPVSHIVVENAGGLRGETGSQGPAGPAGAPGESATVSVGTTTTLPAGSSATVTNTGTTSDAVFNFGIPKGDKGDKGDAGAGLVITGSVATYADLPNDLGPEDAGKAYFVEADGKLYVWSGTQFPADGEGSQFEGPQGPAGQDGQDGADGQAATITVGSTTTLTPGSSATVTNSGTTSAAILDFGIPAGAKGETGETGPAPEAYETATGNPITLTDAGYSVKELNKFYGDTFQQQYTGKNVLDVFEGDKTPGTTTSNNGVDYTLNSDGTITVYGTATARSDYTLLLNTGHRINGTNKKLVGEIVSGTFSASVGFLIYDGSYDKNTYVSCTEVGVPLATNTLETDVEYARVRVRIGNGQSANCVVRMMVIDSSISDLSYEPYVGGVPAPSPDYPQAINVVTGTQTVTVTDGDLQSQTYSVRLGSIELCKIGTYQDYIYKNNDSWYLHKAVYKLTMDGSETWYYNSSSKNLVLQNYTGPAWVSYSNGGAVWCNYFVSRAQGQSMGSGLIFAGNSDIVNCNYNGATNFDSADNFKTWLSTHNMVMYYPLATPTDTQITDTDLISDLNALNEASLYEGDTDITVTGASPNLAGTLDLDYWTVFKGEPGEATAETIDLSAYVNATFSTSITRCYLSVYGKVAVLEAYMKANAVPSYTTIVTIPEQYRPGHHQTVFMNTEQSTPGLIPLLVNYQNGVVQTTVAIANANTYVRCGGSWIIGA
jgi:hypothetical protein